MTDEFYMQRCIQLALLGKGSVAPNPLVGAVLVHEGRIIGEGYHQIYGQAHAEVNCVNSVQEADKHLIPKSTLYVSLEPCSHFGKTPPCTNLIIDNKIPSVVIGSVDINSAVSGKGIERLKNAGVSVKTGICEKECIQLNKRFFTSLAKNRPYIILKWAQSENGMIAKTGERTAISNTYTNLEAHRWRSEEDAILVGHHTAVTDNPQLTNRYWGDKQPVRVMLCTQLPAEDFRMYYEPGKTIIFNTEANKESGNKQFIKVGRENYLNEGLQRLHEERIQSVLVEGGSYTLQQFINGGLWDECRIITAGGLVITDGVKAPALNKGELLKEEQIRSDRIEYYGNPYNQFVVTD